MQKFHKRNRLLALHPAGAVAAREFLNLIRRDKVEIPLHAVLEERDQAIGGKDRAIEARDRENQELRRKLREAGIDP